MRPAWWIGVVVVAAGLLTGCAAKMDVAGTDWAKPNTGRGQITRDQYQCVWEASRSVRTPDLIVGGWFDVARYSIEEHQRGSGFNRCMTSRGYKRVS